MEGTNGGWRAFSSGRDREIPRAIYGMVIEILPTAAPAFTQNTYAVSATYPVRGNGKTTGPRSGPLSLFFLDGITRDAR